MEDITTIEILSDPIFHAKVDIDGFSGHVACAEQGSVSKKRLYRVRYDDGDQEHFTLSEVEGLLVSKIINRQVPLEQKEDLLQDIPTTELLSDPVFHAKVDVHGSSGHVDYIEQGTVTNQLYDRVRYDDGDHQHFTLSEVQEFLIDSKAR